MSKTPLGEFNLGALVGAIVLLSTNYALYSSSESAKKKLAQENAALKSHADETQQQLDAKNAQDAKDAHAPRGASGESVARKYLPPVFSARLRKPSAGERTTSRPSRGAKRGR